MMLKRLSRRCSGKHVHQHLVGGRAKAAEDYSVQLVTDILRGMRDTADHEEEWGDSDGHDIDQAMMTAWSRFPIVMVELPMVEVVGVAPIVH